MNTKSLLVIIMAIACATIYQASEWWERAFATYQRSEVSPDGCIRIDTYEPFWILPSVFHRIPDPDPDPAFRNDLGMSWDAPIFKRAYEASTGVFLGETLVFDASTVIDFPYWGDTKTPGRRVVSVNQFPIVDSPRCSDEATLAKLESFYEQVREANRPIVESWQTQAGEGDDQGDATP